MPIDSSVTIVLVEDDPGHARLIERNLRRAHVSNAIVVLRDGQAALEYLYQDNSQGRRGIPTRRLVLLDLNLPVMDGYQVLTRLKTHESTRYIPVIILTTTDEPYEIERCYALGCNVYITKPVEYEKFVEAISSLGLLLSIIQVPTGA